ncbi:antibiotic biosynthesis monooxygenase family protein [Shimia biformata]|uniref:antibiotic biosynthesis monooxygenase family protein n=1 Tax=Shimia biformata TaxID=1294299 RepID=UPI00194DC4AB|nr:antibiotic biosynthesis monooxygenase [Shimia biformata]
MKTFLDRGVLSECADAIPGFIDGELRASVEDPDRVCVLARWRDAESYHAWGTHPARAAQLADIGHLVAEIELAEVFGPVFQG